MSPFKDETNAISSYKDPKTNILYGRVLADFPIFSSEPGTLNRTTSRRQKLGQEQVKVDEEKIELQEVKDEDEELAKEDFYVAGKKYKLREVNKFVEYLLSTMKKVAQKVPFDQNDICEIKGGLHEKSRTGDCRH